MSLEQRMRLRKQDSFFVLPCGAHAFFSMVAADLLERVAGRAWLWLLVQEGGCGRARDTGGLRR